MSWETSKSTTGLDVSLSSYLPMSTASITNFETLQSMFIGTVTVFAFLTILYIFMVFNLSLAIIIKQNTLELTNIILTMTRDVKKR